jgi:hypothetical protein
MKKQILTLLTLALATALSAQIPNYVPTNGLVGWWPFNGNANDESGNGNNGTVNGATLTTDRFGLANKAYSFDGVDDYIEVANNSSVTLIGNMSMSAWVKTNGYNNQNYQTIISKRETYWTWEYSMALSFHGGIPHDTKLIGSRALAMGNQEQVWTTNSYNPNVWEYWTIVFNNGLISIYKNGILDVSSTFSLIPNQQNCPLLFGRNSMSDITEQFFGSIDDIGIWNRALTACEIQDLYNSEFNSSSGITAGPDQTICKGDTAVLIGSGAVSYTWNNNVVDGQAFVPNNTAEYIVNGTDANGCIGTDSVVVTVNDHTFFTETQTALDTYTWPLNGQTYTQSGLYYDTLLNAAGCDSVITLDLTLSFTGIETLQMNGSKKLLKITDLNGKETPFKKNTVLLFIYEDGTVERAYVTE